MGRPAVPCGSPSSLKPTRAVLPGGPGDEGPAVMGGVGKLVAHALDESRAPPMGRGPGRAS
jgi:hypothetical protein